MPTINNALNEQFTQYSTITGGANNAINNVAPSSTSGVPLISQGASAQPLYGTAAVAGGGTGQTTLTSHGVLVGAGTSAITQLAAGTANTVLISGGSSADPLYTTNFKITSDVMTNTSQPAFQAIKNGAASNVTGDGVAYTIGTLTSTFDQASNFNTTSGTFTAPVTGRYVLGFTVALSGLTSSHVIGAAQIVTTSQTFDVWRGSPAGMKTSGNFLTLSGSNIFAMSANNTATFVVTISSGTRVVNVVASTTMVWGYLVC